MCAQIRRVKRKWEPRELRLVSEFAAEYFPDCEIRMRVRLGRPTPELDIPDLTPKEAMLLAVWRRWADALIICPEKIILVEAAIRPDPGDISKLELYKRPYQNLHLFP